MKKGNLEPQGLAAKNREQHVYSQQSSESVALERKLLYDWFDAYEISPKTGKRFRQPFPGLQVLSSAPAKITQSLLPD